MDVHINRPDFMATKLSIMNANWDQVWLAIEFNYRIGARKFHIDFEGDPSPDSQQHNHIWPLCDVATYVEILSPGGGAKVHELCPAITFLEWKDEGDKEYRCYCICHEGEFNAQPKERDDTRQGSTPTYRNGQDRNHDQHDETTPHRSPAGIGDAQGSDIIDISKTR